MSRRLACICILSVALHWLFFWTLDTFRFVRLGSRSSASSIQQISLEWHPLVRDRTHASHGEGVPDRSFNALPMDDYVAPAASDAQPQPNAQAAATDTVMSKFLPATGLTQSPRPLDEITLDTPEIENVAVPGLVELTIRVEADGRVVEVLANVSDDGSQEYVRLLKERFSSARFSPGFLNGHAVPSELHINVVSEPDVR